MNVRVRGAREQHIGAASLRLGEQRVGAQQRQRVDGGTQCPSPVERWQRHRQSVPRLKAGRQRLRTASGHESKTRAEAIAPVEGEPPTAREVVMR